MLALADELVLASDQHLGAVEAFSHEGATLARVVWTCDGVVSGRGR